MGQSWAYDGRRERPFHPWRGGRRDCCGQCGGPLDRCHCHECRREAKFLLVEDTSDNTGKIINLQSDVAPLTAATDGLEANTRTKGVGTDYIGGDCCVTLSVEVAANTTTSAFSAAVAVRDTEGDRLTWSKSEPAGTRYKVHEHVITTRPGAKLSVVANNCTVRVRWCECFSC